MYYFILVVYISRLPTEEIVNYGFMSMFFFSEELSPIIVQLHPGVPRIQSGTAYKTLELRELYNMPNTHVIVSLAKNVLRVRSAHTNRLLLSFVEVNIENGQSKHFIIITLSHSQILILASQFAFQATVRRRRIYGRPFADV